MSKEMKQVQEDIFYYIENNLIVQDFFQEARAACKAINAPLFEGVPRPESFWTIDQFNSLLRWGVTELNVSDIELEPNCPPFVKFNGKWAMACRRIFVSNPDIEIIVEHISGNKGAVASAKSGKPMDFRYQIEVGRGVYRRFRCNVTSKTLPDGQQALSIVMRAIPWKLPELADVMVLPEDVSDYIVDTGLVAITGPMGSGKTTTMAAIAKFRRQLFPDESFGTYENPIEFDYSRCKGAGPLWQVEIPFGLKDMKDVAANMARRSPNVILIGESRDRDSFQAVLGAANMGVCLYTTLHSNSVADAIYRIVNEMPEERQHSSMGTLVGFARYFVHQRLVQGTPLPDGGQRRIPLRETLRFTDSMRMELTSASSINMAVCRIHEFVRSNGKTLLADAQEKFDSGLISKNSLSIIEAEFLDRERTIEKTIKKEKTMF